MTYEITQWLEEIKSLQQQLAQAQSEREAAQASAAHWRELYNTEAQQRRNEAKQAEQIIANLKQEIQQLKEKHTFLKTDNNSESIAIEKELEKIPVNELKIKLAEIMQQRERLLSENERLTEALKAEKAAHIKTRESLTTALGDTIELLKATRAAILKSESSPGSSPSPTQSTAPPYQTKNPLLQLPPINPDQSPA